MNFEDLKFPDPNFEIPTEDPETPDEKGKRSEPSTEVIREKLLSLAEKGKINYAPKYIQKANRDALEKIKIRYDRKHTEKSSKIISNLIVSKLSIILEKAELIDSSSELKQELDENELFKEELSEMVNDELMPLIPKIGLVSGGVTVAEHLLKKHGKKQSDETKEPPSKMNETKEPPSKMNEPPNVDLNF